MRFYICIIVAKARFLTVDNTSINLPLDTSKQLTATTTLAGSQIAWKSSDTSIAEVDSIGKVTGIKEVICTITATTPDGLTATCRVTVTRKDDPQPT